MKKANSKRLYDSINVTFLNEKILFYLVFNFIHLFLERREGKEKERNINVQNFRNAVKIRSATGIKDRGEKMGEVWVLF